VAEHLQQRQLQRVLTDSASFPPASIVTPLESGTILEKDFQHCSLSDAGPKSLLKSPGFANRCSAAAKLKGQVMEGVPHLLLNLVEFHFCTG